MKPGTLVEITCAGCGETFDWTAKMGKLPKWCSERCRKRSYGLTCPECGGYMDGTTPSKGPKRCGVCARFRNLDRNERVIELWEEGFTAPQIAAEVGWTAPSVSSFVERARRVSGLPIAQHRRSNRTLWPEIERLYHDGLTYAQIAEAVETNMPNVAFMIQTMRQKGIDLPYRIGPKAAA